MFRTRDALQISNGGSLIQSQRPCTNFDTLQVIQVLLHLRNAMGQHKVHMIEPSRSQVQRSHPIFEACGLHMPIIVSKITCGVLYFLQFFTMSRYAIVPYVTQAEAFYDTLHK